MLSINYLAEELGNRYPRFGITSSSEDVIVLISPYEGATVEIRRTPSREGALVSYRYEGYWGKSSFPSTTILTEESLFSFIDGCTEANADVRDAYIDRIESVNDGLW